jgi:2-dehydro-3-deoxyphosphogluconate aldolase / (4S)-4-hydroxy-2-oxoglutarate aldolase
MHDIDSNRTIDSKGAFPTEVSDRLGELGVIAVLVIERAEDAGPVAAALAAGGVQAVELTLRTPVALECIGPIRDAAPEMMVGVGTILRPQQVQDVAAAGAAFGVAPGMNPATVAEARRLGLPFAPGVCTPTDIELALQADCSLLKFFPCEPSGGLPYLRSIAAPFAHLGVRFIPLGGIDPSNAQSYLSDPLIHAVGGSWLAPSALIRDRAWSEITARAAAATKLVERTRGGVAQEPRT